VVCDGVTLTNDEFEQRIRTFASRLADLGVMSGDRVALGAANSPEWVVLVHAVDRLGGILVPLNTRLTSAEIAERLTLFAPCIVIGDDEFRARCPDAVNIQTLSETSGAEQDFGCIPDPNTINTIVSTSGTSGEPKGVCLTFANFFLGAMASSLNLGNRQGERWLINLPLYHVGGLAVVYRAAISGLSIVLHRGFSPEHTLEAIRSGGVTHLSLVEATLARLLEANGDRRFPDTLRAVLVGGGPVDVRLLRRARELGLPVLPTYGLTEAGSQVATMHPGDPIDDFNVGVPPLPGYKVDIRNPQGRPVAAGDEGEIWISGPMVSEGYWTAPGVVTPSLIDGWLPTGDIGALSENGLLSVKGRRAEMIISGGENIYPSEVERALMKLPGIRRAAVIGIRDPVWGQIPVALVEADDLTDGQADRWTAALRETLAGYKIPRRIIPVDTLPTTALGKLERSLLHELYRRATASNRPPSDA